MGMGDLSAKSVQEALPDNQCERCGLTYPGKEKQCPHCKSIKSDEDLESFKAKHEKEQVAGKKPIAGIVVFIIILGVLFYLSL